jgi:3'(2'), 5'-bisphosphate nucleotidase
VPHSAQQLVGPDHGRTDHDQAHDAHGGEPCGHNLHASRISGSPLEYNRPHPYLPDLLICRPELARELIQAVAE